MLTLRILPGGTGLNEQGGEIFSCAYLPDGSAVVSGGWDGHLRLWEARHGGAVAALKASDKPVSACAVAPNGRHWLSGSLDGLLAEWDAVTHERTSAFVPGGRPIAAIEFGDAKTFATASWDGNVVLWQLGGPLDGRPLIGHRDIVTGCRFTPEGRALVSWSQDRTVRLWDVVHGKETAVFKGHADRILCGAVSPDGRWAITGSRDRQLKLWDLQTRIAAGVHTLRAEVRGCFFLLDGERLGAADANGRLSLHAVPNLREVASVATRLPVQCAALAPAGNQIALGCENGQVRLVNIDGCDDVPLSVTATQTPRRRATALQRFFGRDTVTNAYVCVCPACRQSHDLPGAATEQPWPCPNCRRSLRARAVRLAGPQV